jgi:hypothetical protein
VREGSPLACNSSSISNTRTPTVKRGRSALTDEQTHFTCMAVMTPVLTDTPVSICAAWQLR